jgi:hypothetical protein
VCDLTTDVPPVLREHRTPRALLLPAALLACLILLATAWRPHLRHAGLGPAAASLLTAAGVAVTLLTFRRLAQEARRTQCSEPAPPDSVPLAAGIALAGGACAQLALSSWLHPAGAVSVVIGCAAAGVVYALVRRRTRAGMRSRAGRLWSLGSPDQAEQLAADCREELLAPRLSADRRGIVELTLAAALAELSWLGDRYEVLPEALAILDRSWRTGDPAWVVAAAVSLGPAATAKARETGDVEGLEEAMALVANVIDGAPGMLDWIRRSLLWCHAEGHMLLRTQSAAEAQETGDASRAGRLHAAAVQSLRRTLASAPPRSTDRAHLTAELALITADPDDEGLDEAIARCRWALRRLRRRRMRVRESHYLTLAELLAERGTRDTRREDFSEAVRLCELIAEKGDHGYRALYLLALLQDELGADEAVVGAAFRRACAEVAAVSFADGAEVAGDWAFWAGEQGRIDDAADAHRWAVRLLANESRRAVLAGQAQGEPPEIQLLTAEAGRWLLAAGRPREAAVTLDIGGSVHAAERMCGGGDSLEQRLDAAGREDLGERWRQVGGRLSLARPRGSAPARSESEPDALRVGGQVFRPRLSSIDAATTSDHERLVREIGRLPGFEDVEPSPAYADLREAARAAPIVYLGAADGGGFAIIVTEASPEPQVVMLPALTAIEVETRARVLLRARDVAEADRWLDEVLAWLGLNLVTPLVAALPAPALVTIIPLGSLSMLPIAAARMTWQPDGRWKDRTRGLVFRCAPSARALLRAERAARAGNGADPAIWHVAHGVEHDPLDPRSSVVRLEDGPLTVAAMLARGACGRHLAVTSACLAPSASEEPLEEGVGLPSALLRGGLAGVVCSHTPTDDRGAMLLLERFLEAVRNGTDPARALAAAQAWLSDATNREIAAATGAPHEPPAGEPLVDWEQRRDFADPCCWADFGYWGA